METRHYDMPNRHSDRLDLFSAGRLDPPIRLVFSPFHLDSSALFLPLSKHSEGDNLFEVSKSLPAHPSPISEKQAISILQLKFSGPNESADRIRSCYLKLV